MVFLKIKKEGVNISNNGSVSIIDIDPTIVDLMINAIHDKIKFGRKLYCNGVVPLTPQKADQSTESSEKELPTPPVEVRKNLHPSPKNKTSPAVLVAKSACDNDITESVNTQDLSIDKPQKESTSLDVEDNNWPSVSNLVRRHSLSL